MAHPASSRFEHAKAELRNACGGVEEIDSLLAMYAQAASLYSTAVRNLRAIQGTGSPEDLWIAFCEADQVRRRCEQVRLAVHMYFGKKIC